MCRLRNSHIIVLVCIMHRNAVLRTGFAAAVIITVYISIKSIYTSFQQVVGGGGGVS